MSKYLSGRSKRVPQNQLTDNRYSYLSVNQAEPNLGDPLIGPSSIGAKPVPAGPQYIIVSTGTSAGERYWIPNQGGIIPGSISVFDEGNLVGALSSITQLNFVGAAVSASVSIASSNLATITVFAPGNNQELLFNNNNEFGTSPLLTFNSISGLLSVQNNISVGVGGTVITTRNGLVGIGSTLPTQNLDINGNIRLRGTIYDYYNNPGTTAQILIKNSLGGVNWIDQSSVKSGAGGTYTNIQYHNSAGLVDGASNFVFNPANNRVGIGSTLPQQLLDILGYAKFTGQTEIQNLNVTGVGTISRLGVSGLTTTRDLRVVGFATFDQLVDANGGAYIDNITIGINTISTSTGNLTLDSSGGTVSVTDNLIVTGALTAQNTTDSTNKDNGSLVVEGGVGIEKKLYVGGTINASNDILPTSDNLLNLGSPTLTWANIYADTLNGNVTGNSDSATRLQTSRDFSISGDTTAPTVSFDGTANVNLVTTLANSGVVAGTYGSSTQVGILTVDSKGRVTAASNVAIDTSTNANNIRTVVTSTNASFYPTFVDSNNNPAAYEALYTNAGIVYNPSTGNLGIGTTNPGSKVQIGGSITPTVDNLYNLGSTNLKWASVYATSFVGAITGNADTATKLATARNIAITGDLSWSVNFDGNSNVTSTGTLANSGVVAGTYGSSTQVGILTVDVKGRVTAASNVALTSVNVGSANYANIAGVATSVIGGIGSITQLQVTGISTFTNGPVLIGSATSTGTAGQILQVAGINSSVYIGGNLGIGTAIPGSKLQVAGSITPSVDNAYNLGSTNLRWANLYVNSITGTLTGAASSLTVTNDTANASRYFVLSSGTTGITTALVDSDLTYNPSTGNLGIGTTNPQNLLHISGSPGTLLRLDGGAAGTGTRDILFTEFNTTAYGGIIRYDSVADLFTFGTLENSTVINAINVARASGNVGIGTSIPGSKLQVAGSITPSVTNAYDLGSSSLKWNNVYVNNLNIGGTLTGAASSIGITSDTANLSRYLIFSSVSSGTPGITSALVDSDLTYNPSTNVLTVPSLTVSTLGTFNGNVTFGDTNSDTVTFTSRINSNVVPSANNTYDLGSSALRWNNLYVNSITGTLTGAASSLSVTSDTANLSRYLIFSSETTGVTTAFVDSDLTYNPSTGNLGVGVVNATAKLQLNAGALGTTGGNTLTVSDFYHNNGNVSYLRIKATRFTSGTDWFSASTKLLCVTDVTEQGYIEYNPNGATYGLAFGQGSTEFARFLSDGRLGIGTTNPGSKLQVDGSITPTVTNTYDLGSSSLKWNNVYVNNLNIGGTLTGAASSLSVTNDTANANRFLVLSSISSGLTTALVDSNLTFNPATNVLSTTTFSGNLTNTVTGTNSTEIVRGNMADNDQFRILIGGTASNAGFVEIATADDGTEPIYVRQYTGVFTTLTRTATLLDSSGNTSFPGSVTVSSNNATGGGIILSDDGDIVDLNDGYASMRFSNGVKIYSTKSGGSTAITLGSNGQISATSDNAIYATGTNATDDVWGGSIEIREINQVGNTQTGSPWAPGITFHWGNVTSSAIKMYSDGSIRFIAQNSTGSSYRPIYASTFYGNLSGTVDGYGIGGSSGNYFNKIPVIGGDGVMEVGRYLDFHSSAGDTSDFTFRIDNTGAQNLNFSGTLQVNTSAVTTGDALVVQNGGDLRIYSSGNANSVPLYCDAASVLTISGVNFGNTSGAVSGFCGDASNLAMRTPSSGGAHYFQVYNGTTNPPTLATLGNSGFYLYAGTYGGGSSLKIKDNIETIEDSYVDNFIDNVRPVSFVYTNNESDQTHQGFIAEEMFEVSPELVGLDSDNEPQVIYYMEIIPILTNAIQRQKKQIEDLMNRIAALENK